MTSLADLIAKQKQQVVPAVPAPIAVTAQAETLHNSNPPPGTLNIGALMKKMGATAPPDPNPAPSPIANVAAILSGAAPGGIPSSGEIPVSANILAPDRGSRDTLSDVQKFFLDAMDSLYDNSTEAGQLHHDPDMVRGAVQRIMVSMRESPFLADLVLDDDIAIIIKRMKHILGFRKIEAVAKKAKAAPRGKKAKAASELADIFAEVGLLG